MKPAGKRVLLFLLPFLAACASTKLPPHAGARLQLEEDEKRIWTLAAEAERRINRSGAVEEAPELDAYLAEVARRLFPDLPFACRVRVVRDGGMNAFAFPNGAIYLHTGILARMENEAQLAALLGHEVTHAVNRHAVRQSRELKNVSAVYTAVTLGGYGGGLFTMASVTGYARDLEREADAEGYRRMVSAGYEASEAGALFRILERWITETGVRDPYFFSSHPRVRERIESFEGLLAGEPRKGKGVDNRDVFLSKTLRVVLENTEMDLKAGRFESALRGAEKYLSVAPRDPRGHYVRGEVFRQRNEGNDLEQAADCYRLAISSDGSYPEPYRSLGLIHYKRGEKAAARGHLEKYLALTPGAPDRSYIEGYIRSSQ